MIALGDLADTNPFSGSDSSTDTSTTPGGEYPPDNETTPTDDRNSSMLPPTIVDPDPDPPDNQTEDRSGVNFVPEVKNFGISIEEFDESSLDVEDGYITPGEHRLLRFDMIVHNVGDEDAELGYPEENPDIFKPSESHDHYHVEDFIEYTLIDKSDNEVAVLRKQAFCLRDDFQIHSNASSSPQFDCDYQGISAGWADVYPATLPGQYLVITDLPDGEYTLQATTNATGVIEEKCDSVDTVRVNLRIEGNSVTVLDSQTLNTGQSAC